MEATASITRLWTGVPLLRGASRSEERAIPELNRDPRRSQRAVRIRGGHRGELGALPAVRIRPGERVLTLLVPPTVPAGPVTVRLALADLAGNRKGARRQIMIAARADDLSRVLL
jgi:hypothetical protein